MRPALRALVLAVIVTDCGDSTPPTTPSPTIVALAISGTTTLTNTNQTSQLKATATLQNGTTQDVTNTAAWQSSDANIATVSSAGLVTAVAKGTATITATYQGGSGTIAFSSGMAETTSVTIRGIAALADANQTSQLYAIAALADDTTHDVTSAAAWQSSQTNIATVSSAGLVTAVANGTTTITASYQGKTGTLAVSSGITSRSFGSCRNLAAPGRYSLTADISGTGFGPAGSYCLFISGSNIDLQCNGHVVTTIQVGGFGAPDFRFNPAQPQNVLVNNCTSQSINVSNGSNVQVVGNRMTWLRATAPIILSGGRNNIVMQNQIDGGSDGVFNNRIGADDGIALFDETGDIIQDNVIRNVWDAAFESIGALTNTVIANNTMTNMGATAIGAYHGTSWTGNTVRGNVVSQSPNFAMIFWADDNSRRQTQVSFQGNTIEGNRLTNRTSIGEGVIDIRFPHPSFPLPLPLTTGNNLLRNNDLGTTGRGPNVFPPSAFIDGGGNTWSTPVTPFRLVR